MTGSFSLNTSQSSSCILYCIYWNVFGRRGVIGGRMAVSMGQAYLSVPQCPHQYSVRKNSANSSCGHWEDRMLIYTSST